MPDIIPIDYFSLLSAAFVLGMAHGLVPDEHSWPPLLAYAVGAKKDSDMIKAHVTFGLSHIITWIPLFAITAYVGEIVIKESHEPVINIFAGAILIMLGFYSLTHPKHIHLDGEVELVRGPFVLGIVLGFAPCLFTLTMLGLLLFYKSGIILSVIAAIVNGIGTTIAVVVVGFGIRQGVHAVEKKTKKDLCEKFGTIGSAILVVSGFFLFALTFVGH